MFHFNVQQYEQKQSNGSYGLFLASLPDRGHKELLSLPNCFLTVAAHYGMETQWHRLSSLLYSEPACYKEKKGDLSYKVTLKSVLLSVYSAISSLMC